MLNDSFSEFFKELNPGITKSHSVIKKTLSLCFFFGTLILYMLYYNILK